MKQTILLLIAIIAVSCGRGYNPAHMAELYVKAAYPDYRNTIYCKVDTVTYGDNLNYRIEVVQRRIDEDLSNLDYYKRWGGTFSKDRITSLTKSLESNEKRLAALDSLRQNSDLLNHPTAYTVCIAYNQPTNFVWVQMDEYFELLKISKRLEDMYYNPGNDVPGYLEIIRATIPSE